MFDFNSRNTLILYWFLRYVLYVKVSSKNHNASTLSKFVKAFVWLCGIEMSMLQGTYVIFLFICTTTVEIDLNISQWHSTEINITIINLTPSSPILSHLILHSILLFYSRIKWEMMLLTLVLSRRQWRFLASLYKAWYIPVVHIYLYIGSIPVFHIGFEKHYR